jgi:DNA helicase HerA-like ATPase
MESNTDIAIYNSVFRVGVVYSVDGRTVKIRVDKNKNTSHLIYKGTLIKNVSVGSYVKILKGFIPIIGKVESEFIVEDKTSAGDSYHDAANNIGRTLIVKLIGFLEEGHYYRGVNELPLIENECFLLTEWEFDKIHSFGGSDDEYIRIGTLSNDPLVPIKLGIGRLFSSHIGIFGNTGSGKSYTMSKLYRQLFVHYDGNRSFHDHSRFLFFDFNGEYSKDNAIIAGKKVYKLSTRRDAGLDNKIPMEAKDLLDLNLLCIFANATEKTQRPFIKRCIDLYEHVNSDQDTAINQQRFKNYLQAVIKRILVMSDNVKGDLLINYVEAILPKNRDPQTGVDRGLKVDFSFHAVSKCYYASTAGGNIFFNAYPIQIERLTIYSQVQLYQYDANILKNFIDIMYLRLIYDVLDNRAVNEHIAPAIHKLKSAEKDIERVLSFSDHADMWAGNNVVVLDLSDVNVDTKKRIPLLVSNKLYNEHKKQGRNQGHLNIIVDEAHNILSYQSTRESEEWKDYRLEVFEEIIKEGRKFGVFMTIASQRPSDISSTIISQLHNYFIHRLVNQHDIEQVNNTISYLDKVSVESLPILATGVCVVAGQLADMPVLVKIDRIENENKPDNETLDVVKLWKEYQNNENIADAQEA